MSQVISIVVSGDIKYSAYKNGTVTLEHLSLRRELEQRHINSIPLSVQQLFEEDIRVKQAEKHALIRAQECEAALADCEEVPEPVVVEEPTFEELEARVAQLEGLLNEAKTPFAFTKDTTLYRRICDALGQKDPLEIIATHKDALITYRFRRSGVVEMDGLSPKGFILIHSKDLAPSAKEALYSQL